MLMRKIFNIMVFMLLATNLLCACGGNEKLKIEKKDVYKVKVIIDYNDNEYYQYMANGINKRLEESPNLEVEYANEFVDEDYDALIVTKPYIEKVLSVLPKKTKTIVTINSRVIDDKINSNIGFSISDACEKLGIEAVNIAKQRGKENVSVISFAGLKNDAESNEKINGFRTGIITAGAEFRDGDTQYLDRTREATYDAMRVMMQRNPEGVAIVCAVTDDMADAASFTAKGVENYTDTIFVGFGALDKACESIEKGFETLSIGDNPYEEGYMALEKVEQILAEEEVAKHIAAPIDIIDINNVRDRKNLLESYK